MMETPLLTMAVILVTGLVLVVVPVARFLSAVSPQKGDYLS
jgi:hypothetical protein